MQPAGKKWTIDWFKKTMGDLQIGVFDNNVKKHLYSTTVNPDMKMDFGDFLDLITKDKPSSIRMFRYNLYKQNPILRKDFSCPSFIRKLNPMRRFGFMFLGGKDTCKTSLRCRLFQCTSYSILWEKKSNSFPSQI